MRKLLLVATVGGLLATGTAEAGAAPGWFEAGWFEVASLDGSGNNRAHPDWGKAGIGYLRVAPARYTDGIGEPVAGPNPRYVSNRIFNDTGQKLSSPRGVSQWVATWGQFLDHTFGRRQPGTERKTIPYDNADPLERFRNDFGVIQFDRTTPVAGTGGTTPREQVNLLSSYLNAMAVYGNTNDRLEWMRDGPVDGDLTNNGAHLLLPNGMLPRGDYRGDIRTAPPMDDAAGGMRGRGAVAGDVRANENTGLLALQTLFAREHNRVVDMLPKSLPEEQKFQIARRVVIATQQYITYEQFLPTLGVHLKPYTGYKPDVNATIGNEFATVGYRAHSMLNSVMRFKTDAARYTPAQLDALRAKGVVVAVTENSVELTLSPEIMLFNPDLLDQIGLAPALQGLGRYAQAANDEQVGDLTRSIPVKVPPGCAPADCKQVVFDIAAVDIERGRDHGMPGYQQLRAAYGLSSKSSFPAVTGESTEQFPADPLLTPGNEINDPQALDFVRLRDANGRPLPLDSQDAVAGDRRTTVAARLKAVYGDISQLDAFTGMSAEPKLPGSEFGELQSAIWRKQFEALRDGDRFFYGNDPMLLLIKLKYGIDFRQNLGDVIAHNTDVPRNQLPANVFRAL